MCVCVYVKRVCVWCVCVRGGVWVWVGVLSEGGVCVWLWDDRSGWVGRLEEREVCVG